MPSLTGRKQSKEHIEKRMKAGAGRPRNTPERLWSLVDKKSPNDCWPWLGGLNEQGYGRIQIGQKNYYAHRVIFNLANPGVIELSAPKQRDAHGFLMHSCDNPQCCNPAHLSVATQKQNMQDRLAKGRYVMPSGGNHHRSLFTDDEISEVLDMHSNGCTSREIATKFGVSRNTILSLLYRHRTVKTPRIVFTKEQIAEILRLNETGLTKKEIGAMFGKSRPTISSVIRRNIRNV